GIVVGVEKSWYDDNCRDVDDSWRYLIVVRSWRRDVDQMQQNTSARQMSQELVPDAGSVGGAFDQAGYVGHYEAARGRSAHYSQIGMKRGEWVISDLGTCVGDLADKRGFARIG